MCQADLRHKLDYSTFVEAIPFQIYAILAIIMIPLVAFTKKDFSQMKETETEEAVLSGGLFGDHCSTISDTS